MGSFLERFKLSEFMKHMATLMVGSGLSQIIPFLLAPILARLYSPTEFGVFAFFISIVTLISSISTGRYELAIVIAKEDREAAVLSYLSMGFSMAVSLISLLVLKAIQWNGTVLFSGLISENWVYLIPIMIWLYALLQVYRYLGIRYKKFQAISYSSISDSANRGGVNILLGYTIGEAFGLVIGGFFGVFSSVLILFSSLNKKIKPFFGAITKGDFKEQIIAYKKFPIYDAPSALFHNFGNQGVVIIMTKLLGQTVVGIYSYTERILITPVAFLSGTFSQVFFQKASSVFHKNQKEFQRLLAKTMNGFILLGIIPFTIFVYTSKYYIPIFLGDQWLELYKYVYVLSPYIFMIFISAPLGHVLNIVSRQEVTLILKIVFFTLRFAALFFGFWMGFSPLMTLFYFSILSVVSLMISLISIHKVSGAKISWSVWLLNIMNIGVFIVLYYFINANELLQY